MALVGLAVAGVAVARLSVTWGWVGGALLVAGTAASAWGGVMYDAGTDASLTHELEQVEEGDVHEGTRPGQMLHGEAVQGDARRTTAQVHERLASGPRSRPTATPVVGWVLAAVAGLIVVSQPWFIDNTATGRASALRDGGLAIVIGLAGVWLANSAAAARPVLLAAAAAGVGLVLAGLLADHSLDRLAAWEVGCGLLVVLAAVAPLAPPRGRRGRQG